MEGARGEGGREQPTAKVEEPIFLFRAPSIKEGHDKEGEGGRLEMEPARESAREEGWKDVLV